MPVFNALGGLCPTNEGGARRLIERLSVRGVGEMIALVGGCVKVSIMVLVKGKNRVFVFPVEVGGASIFLDIEGTACFHQSVIWG